MYYLMNKDRMIASLEVKPATAFSDSISFKAAETLGKMPIGFKDAGAWIDGRKASKHNSHLQALMKQMGCDNNEGFIRVTHAATINDTFWIKSDREDVSWEQVSLYRNQFTESISRLAFEGVGLYDAGFTSTSPELACDGSFRKCFRKEDHMGECGSDIFLYKRGRELGAGLEPYCEAMASEIAKAVSPNNAISYELATLHGRLASRCNLFTNEQLGYASFAKVTDTQGLDLEKIFGYFEKAGSEQQFREMLVTDSLCFNQDRHTGNYGVLFDNDTLQIIQMAPIFDMNLSLLPYVEMDEFENIGDRLFEYAPKLGEDFTRIGQMGMNDVIRERVKDMRDFSFSFRGDDRFPPERVKIIEGIVRRQAEAILSNDRQYTKDVFFSQKAQDAEQNREKSARAAELLNGFSEIVENMDLGGDVFTSICASTDTVQYYFEKERFMLTIDFLKGSVAVSDNMQPLSFGELKKTDEAFWKTGRAIQQSLKKYLKSKGDKSFDGYFKQAGSGLDSDSIRQ